MRLGEVLSRAPSTTPRQVEGFLGARKIAWGKHKSIRAGKVGLNVYCATCGDIRTFMSAEELSCLVTSERTVSIDVSLRCSFCGEASMEVWFLVACDGDMYAQAPVVYLERVTEDRRKLSLPSEAGFESLLERAKIAHASGLGAGAMVYLRRIFEDITVQVAELSGIPTLGMNGKRVTFRDLLQTVDARHHIVPQVFATSGYRLFSELSEVIHGRVSEEEALRKYPPCKQLVMGVVENVRQNEEIARAIDALGWNVDGFEAIVRDGMTNAAE